ncbi:hypothetical protein FSP39_011046 [Pinctada imbricata]|uniref:Thioredoxin domain-containing protein n=1 Tax=Pinctada imbricata TaxID=66713 RepID=A0AA89BRR5_PINIB|nr:hypothetical protein FSP39_011046 [Pinctada imbricata]
MMLRAVVSVFFAFLAFSDSKPITITEDNWRETLKGEWMIEFMAPWCPACKQFTETWEKFSDWSRDLDIKIGVVDVTENPGLSGRFLISALPTIYHIKDGVCRQYKGGRRETELISFVDDKKWNDLDPVPWWYAPTSIQMSGVSFFFKTAMMFRSLYNTMTSEYGIPEWACYIIFAILTIIAGLVIGLLIVICCDFVCPAKPPGIPPRKLRKGDGDGATGQKEDEDADGEDSETDLIDDREPAEDSQAGEESQNSQAEEEEDTQTSENTSTSPLDSDMKPRRRRVKKAD